MPLQTASPSRERASSAASARPVTQSVPKPAFAATAATASTIVLG